MGGWDKVRIYQTADTNIFMPLPWVGWNAGGSEAIWGTIIERMSLETAITTSTNRAGFFWIGSGVQYPLRRMVVRDVSISGFYQGFRAVNGVGLIMQNCDIRRNNYGIHLSKVDNVILQRCTVGEGFGGVEWGTTRSVGILYEGPAPFNLNIFGCEYGGDTHSILAIGGYISVIGGNLEQDNLVDTPDKALMYGPPIMFDGVSSGVIANIRISSVNPQNQLTNPLVYLKGGSGKVTHIVANGWTSNNNAYPHIRLDTAADYVNGETSSLWVTNTATLDGYGLGLRKNAKQFSSQSGATGANDSSWTRTNNAAFTAGLTGTQRGVVVRNTLGGNGPAFLMESATPNNYHSWKVYGDFNHGHVGMTFHEGENIGFYYTNNTGWFCISKNANVGNPIIIAQDGNASSSRTVAIRSQSNPVRNPFEIWNSANVVQAGISETFRWWGNTAFTNLNSVNGHNYTNLPINLTPGNTATPAAWERITNNGVLYYRPLYQ
jgi:hypothetical protein